MKKVLLSILAALVCCSAFSQQIRTNYRSGGFTHISTDYEDIKLADIPSEMRVELVGLPDGSSMYLLYINLIQKEAVVTPKGVKMSATLPSGKFIRLDQIGQDSATKRRREDGLFVNRLKYAAEPADIGFGKLCAEVSHAVPAAVKIHFLDGLLRSVGGCKYAVCSTVFQRFHSRVEALDGSACLYADTEQISCPASLH